ncbi:glycoside hydrolase family 36 protein [Mucilaginibacter psychrotolerans]|uniref:Alpha-galactosidase n=1 Tax=Mucilaginibacter psychrotolerans TaxID=1524096 RepID=A0A4Y8S3P0_9SPHI|nr:glycoside hydrolase family 36 protein [Mucilaginibacter psychrotolerans]TFF33562.1 alpha-galactosidase [Mucilaginibacter psychrotolerans]
MKLKFFLLFFFLLAVKSLKAQQFASWNTTALTLNNGIVERVIQLPAPTGHFFTTQYKPVSGKFQLLDSVSTDFQFEINDQLYSGSRTNWRLIAIKNCSDATSGNGAAVTLLNEEHQFELTVQYLLYPGSAAIRKSLTLKNLSAATLKLESVDVEKLDLNPDAPTFSSVAHDYGRRRALGPYDGNMQDALVAVHNSQWQQGIVVGNEAAGVVKHTSFFWGGMDICSGFTHKDARYPFRKYILPGQVFSTAQVFTMVYNNCKDAGEILNTQVADFVRKYLGSRLSLLKQKPTFVYNTWEPFGSNINEQLVMELARAAAKAGMKEFVIDDGWQDSYGDWGIDKKKFPHGLKPVFDYIKSLGMKPGLWISVGSATPDSKVFKAHPEWFVKDKNGKLTSLHLDVDADRYTACFSTGWYDYIKDILLKLALDNGLEYMKLDFAVVTSPYRYDASASGCYAANHPGHQDHHESLYANYEQVWKLFDELHAAKPGLFIDCTFETMGGLQLIDYAMLKHAEGNWLSNFTGHGQEIDLSIRNMAWWRSPAIPATALVIGNPEMQDASWDLHIKSLAGALPIMLGDPRKLTTAELTKYRQFADWLQRMDLRYRIMSFRQDLPGFGEPMEGYWDGFQRINTETKAGGIVGIFRQGSTETERRVTVFNLDPLKTYQIKKMDGTVICTQTGNYLSKQGFEVIFTKKYDGELFEIAAKGLK